MLDTRKFWFVEPTDQLQAWRPVLNEYQSATPWPTIEPPQKQDFLHTVRCLAPRIQHLAQMEYRILHGDYHLKTAILSWSTL